MWGSYNDKLQQGWYFSFFMLNGICVAFFDLLTYPLVAFGVPLILALLLDGFTTVKEGIKKLATYSFGWIIGYAGMWGEKWLAGSVLTGKDLISDAIAQIGLRTHGQGEYKGVLTYGNTLKTIWNSINDLPMLILLISFIGIITIYLIRNKCRVSYDINRLKRSACFLLIGLSPFVWFFVAMNHSIVHPWMSYRELAIIVNVKTNFVLTFTPRRARAAKRLISVRARSHPPEAAIVNGKYFCRLL